MPSLTGKQRQYLKGLAHPLAPVVRVGKGGASATVIEETKKSLFGLELIKVRIDTDDSDARRALAEQLAKETDAQIAGMVGKIAIFYRARDEEPEIRLPR